MNGTGEILAGERRLSELRRGESGIVSRLDLDGAQRRRLMDLGIVPGTEIVMAFASPLGDPKSYRVKQTLIALRDQQASHVILKSPTQRTAQSEGAPEA